VTFVTDAMTDRDADAHRNSLEKIFPRMGETDTTENVLKCLQEASGSESRP
jgi:isochorismate hydrolase